jgi:hypothetical protein
VYQHPFCRIAISFEPPNRSPCTAKTNPDLPSTTHLFRSTASPQIHVRHKPTERYVTRGERTAATSPSEQRPLGMDVAEEGTTRRWLSRPTPPAEPLDVEGDAAATAFSRCLSSAPLIRLRSSPAPPPPRGLYISVPDQPPVTLPPQPALSHAIAARRRARVGLGIARGVGGGARSTRAGRKEERAANFEGADGCECKMILGGRNPSKQP